MISISVVVPSYNHGRYLGTCIQSALQQTLPPKEVIVVDDGSTDGSRAVIESFGKAIRPHFQSNCGTYATLNAAIAQASGDWIAIHNSDDVWQPQKLQQQAQLALAQPSLGLIHTGFVCINADGAPDVTGASDLPDFHGPSVSEMLPLLLRSNPTIVSSVMISRVAWERCGPFDARYLGMGDWDLYLKISQEFLFGFIDAPLTSYRKHTTNSSKDATRIPVDWMRRDWQILGQETLPAAARVLFARAQRGEIDHQEAAHALACLATIYTWGKQSAWGRSMYTLSLRLDPLRWQTYLRYMTTWLPHALRTRIR